MLCHTCNTLLEENFQATTRYHQAIIRLTEIAGSDKRHMFDFAKLECTACLDECRRTTEAFKNHKTEHRNGIVTRQLLVRGSSIGIESRE